MRDGLAIVKRFDRIAAADDAAFLNPAIEARSIVQWQIERHAEKFLEILAGEIKSPSKKDGVADPEALSDQMIQGDAWGSRFGQAWGSEETEERRRKRSRRQRSHFAFEPVPPSP